MGPVVYLVLFCVLMTVIAAGKLLYEDRRPIHDGAIFAIIFGVTGLAVAWAGIQETWFENDYNLLGGLVVGSVVAIGLGAWLLAADWNGIDRRVDEHEG